MGQMLRRDYGIMHATLQVETGKANRPFAPHDVV
jgi:hypothetical protein